MLNVGDKVPDFTLPVAYADGRKDAVQFNTLLGNGPIVIAFYPLAFSGGCTKHMCDMRDTQANLATLKAQSFGFSIDAHFTNIHFAKAHGLTHGIFSDANRSVVDQLWETMTVVGVERAAKRGFLVISPEGVVVEKWVTDNPSEWIGMSAVEAALSKLN